MGKETKIEWCDHTFNPWRGCTKVSPGCANCYADTQAARFPLTLGVWGAQGTRVVASESGWREPLAWDRAAKKAGVRRRVFCASMADVFEDWRGPIADAEGRQLFVDGESWFAPSKDSFSMSPSLSMRHVRIRLFRLIDRTPNLDWLLLTKRPENVARMMPKFRDSECDHPRRTCDEVGCTGGVRPNVWLGTSVENQATADERIPHLLCVSAAVRWLSCEPLLSEVDLSRYLSGLGWVVIGGESGADARPCNVADVRSLVQQCRAAGVAPFVKQLGSEPVGNDDDAINSSLPTKYALGTILLADSKGGDPAEWPEDLRVREYPQGEALTSQ